MEQPESQYGAFWLFKRKEDWRDKLHPQWDATVEEFAAVVENPGEGVTVRATYSSMGLCADVEMIIWAHAPELGQLSALAVKLDRTVIGATLIMHENYIGTAGMSQYDPTHGPAFIKGIPAKRYLSVYPFTKTPDWFLIDYAERRRLMLEHGEMGREFSELLTNTLNSFGIQDQEFIVALEDDDPNQLVLMVQKLRGAEVRKYTSVDTPIFLGDKKPVREVLDDIKG